MPGFLVAHDIITIGRPNNHISYMCTQNYEFMLDPMR